MTPAQAARQLICSQHHGVLSTLSVKLEGFPFGSVVDYVIDHHARPVFLISALAEHTRNIGRDSRVSLVVYSAGREVQASPRLTLVGHAHPVADEHHEGTKARYLRYFPDALPYLALDFSFYVIEPAQLRYIAGFGEARWLSAEAYRPPENTLEQEEAGMIAHMNQEHLPSLRNYCLHYHGIDPQNVSMLGIDSDGFDVRADSQILRFEFEHPISDAHAARKVLVAMAQESGNNE